jgi:hypothetical protein
VERVGEHSVLPGPLAPRWRAWSLDPPRAGVLGGARLALDNAGSATWRSHGEDGVLVSYHWLDGLGNPIVWDGLRFALPRPVAPGESVELDLQVLAPRPPGAYRLAFDLVEEHRFWFSEIGCAMLELPVAVAPRIAERRLLVRMHGGADEASAAALAAQEEPVVEGDAEVVAHLVPGAVPAADWSRRLLDAHAEGWAAVGGSIAAERRAEARRFTAWAPGGGRDPRFRVPLLLPSLLDGAEPGTHLGLPAYAGEGGLFDGRIVVRLLPQSDRRPS